MASSYVLVDPDSTLNFSHDWSDWLAVGDTIASRQWSITPLNGTSPETPTLVGDTTDIVFVSGLMPGRIYHLVEAIETSSGLRDDRTIVLRCDQR